jgi:hypothetical protein
MMNPSARWLNNDWKTEDPPVVVVVAASDDLEGVLDFFWAWRIRWACSLRLRSFSVWDSDLDSRCAYREFVVVVVVVVVVVGMRGGYMVG